MEILIGFGAYLLMVACSIYVLTAARVYWERNSISYADKRGMVREREE
jgi:hypothetical protein